jgi:hypothetical protein
VNLGAAQTKNRKGARQSISLALADELRAHATGEPAALFNLPRKWEMVTMLRADVEAARALWLADADCPEERNIRTESDFLKVRTAAGVLDFHSLRHSTGSWLARSGVAPHIVQKVMRHSTMELTFGTYGHLFGDELQSAVGKVAVSLRPVGRISATKGATKNVTKRAPESTLEAPEAKPALGGRYLDFPEEIRDNSPHGWMAERFKAPVLKTGELVEITGKTANSAKRDHRRDHSCAELALIDRLLSALSGLNESSLRQVTELAESLSRSQSPEEVSL